MVQKTISAHEPIDLFTPLRVGPYLLKNRTVMAPLTRNRAGAGNVPQVSNVEYYAQRASAGRKSLARTGARRHAFGELHASPRIATMRFMEVSEISEIPTNGQPHGADGRGSRICRFPL